MLVEVNFLHKNQWRMNFNLKKARKHEYFQNKKNLSVSLIVLFHGYIKVDRD